MNDSKIIIAIDGPSGTGKSTICKLIANKLDLSYIDTGAIYRSVALSAINNNLDFNDEAGLQKLCLQIPIRFNFINGINHIFIKDDDVSEKIRTPEISMAASKVSAIPIVRSSLLDIQRRIAYTTDKKGTILDGRDIGTVVFPNADIKIFLTASDKVRAERRYNELKEKKIDVNFEQVLQETIQRDKQDSERLIAPLKKANDAIEVNTDKMNIEAVLSEIEKIISKHF